MPHVPRSPGQATITPDTQEATRPSLFGNRVSLKGHEVAPEDVAQQLFGGSVVLNELTGALEADGTATERRLAGQRTTG